MGRAEADLVRACNRVLFSAWKEPPGSNGRVAYDGFGEITLSAMAMPCFPDMHFPSSISDAEGIKLFLAQLALTHPLLRETRQARAFQASDRLFIVTEGMVTFQVEGENLSRRLSIAMAITEHRGWLLIWFFGAPHDSELRELMNTKMTLDSEPPPTQTRAAETTAGGGTSSSEVQPPVASEAGTPGSGGAGNAMPPTDAAASGSKTEPAAGNASTPSIPPSPAASSSDTQQPNASATSASSPPSLLRPGESMDEQQMKGVPVPKKH